MNCIFCHNILDLYTPQSSQIVYFCNYKECNIRDMTRYKIYVDVLLSKSTLTTRIIMLGDFYIKFHYQENITEISKLIHCCYMDTIRIYKILELDLENPNSILPKIKTLMLFS